VLSQGVSLSDHPKLISKIRRNEKILESKPLAANIQSALSQRLQPVSQHETDCGVRRAYRGITPYLGSPHSLPKQTEKYSAL
jgi:hypothetical protein